MFLVPRRSELLFMKGTSLVLNLQGTQIWKVVKVTRCEDSDARFNVMISLESDPNPFAVTLKDGQIIEEFEFYRDIHALLPCDEEIDLLLEKMCE